MLLWVISGIFVYQIINVGFKLIKRARADDTPHDYFKWALLGNKKRRLPIVTHEKYDIAYYGVEKLLFFDTDKWIKMQRLIKNHFKDEYSLMRPLKEADMQLLSTHHDMDYLKNLHYSNSTIIEVSGLEFLKWFPNAILRSLLITPFKWHASGTILASREAMLHGAAINLGGGWHHAYKTRGTPGGFCFVDDIGLVISYLWEKVNKDLKFFIIDLDAHQGNGYELDKSFLPPEDREKILIMDMYNKDIFPGDETAKLQINYKIEIKNGTTTEEYLDILKKAIATNGEAIKKFKPDLVIYVAGCDILEGDQLGLMNVSSEGVIERDELVFKFCRDNNFPVVLLTSGGIQTIVAEVVFDSVKNLAEQGLIKAVVDEEPGVKR